MKRTLIVLFALFVFALPVLHAADMAFREGDVFEMRLTGPPEEFTREYNLTLTVDNGGVNLPVIGRVAVAGLSRAQLAEAIEQRLKDAKVFTSAKVSIVTEFSCARSFIIGGSVRAPGRQMWTSGITLTGAIGAAGGLVWHFGNVKIIRAGKAIPYSLKAIRKNPESDPKIEPGDIIEIGDD